MSLNAKDVGEILKALEASTFDSLDLQVGDVKLSLRRSGSGGSPAVSAAPTVPVLRAAGPGAHAPVEHEPAATSAAASVAATGKSPQEAPPGTQAVPAPLLGVFYRAPKPGEPPFVEIGSRVQPQTIIGIIEVMKLMNSVRAGVSGTVVAIPARNGELVEFGEPLLHVRPD